MKRITILLLIALSALISEVRATTTVTFKAIVLGGIYDGTFGTGFLTYDETLGDGTFLPADGVEVELTIFGQTFTHEDDVDFPDFPELDVFDGLPEFLDFLVADNEPVDILEPGVFAIQTGPLVPSDEVDFDYYLLTLVNEGEGIPDAASSVTLLSLGLVSLVGLKRRLAGK